ncbi:MAG: hypothetical protein KGJ79_08035 [Alphaproteobacteria bacterium]|nr:hypothetical protein [Alphaproteobacteria bacterium]MDE2111077.1 hypothetical protein [Alphaproteobacteria bacterium]MDE2494777.1 hypothetical protein [Alphaproteobacteria bacterium]
MRTAPDIPNLRTGSAPALMIIVEQAVSNTGWRLHIDRRRAQITPTHQTMHTSGAFAREPAVLFYTFAGNFVPAHKLLTAAALTVVAGLSFPAFARQPIIGETS